MNKLDYCKILSWSKRIKAFEILGGKCEKCSDDNIFHLTFHHIDSTEKEKSLNELRNLRWSRIEKELKKCKLLCSNCHQELHFSGNIDRRKFSNKKFVLEFKNVNGCEICKYNKCNSSLHFHHLDRKNKKFEISNFSKKIKSINDFSIDLISELNKCEVICSNCHKEKHTDKEFFFKFEKEIYDKSKNIKEINSKLDRTLIKKLYFDDKLKQKEIVEYFNCSKGTISDIIKELKSSRSSTD